jgi:iron complex transport system substrate-binding protein
VQLAAPARRVVTIPMPAAALLVAVDGTVDHLVGMHPSSWAAMHDGILGELFPRALAIPHAVAAADFAPNVESVVALRPDVVVQWGDRGTGLTAALENAGLTVMGLQYGTQEDLLAWVSLFAAVLGRPERARLITEAIEASRQQELRTAASVASGRPKVLYFNRFAQGLKVAGDATYNDFCIRLVGAANPAAGPSGAPGKGMVGVDVEQVLAWDPDVVLLGNFDGAVPDDVYRDPKWRRLSAVRRRRVYKVPLGGYRWDPPSHESPLMWRWLSMVTFPAQPASDLRGEIDRYYTLYYGTTPNRAQTDAILRTALNGASANYRVFDGA